MNGAEVQNLIERLREARWKLASHETRTIGGLMDMHNLLREAADTLEHLENKLVFAQQERDRYRALLSEHHSVGGLEGFLVGDVCPLCEGAKL